MNRYKSQRGITMIEAVIGSLLVGMVLASTLSIMGPVLRSSQLVEQEVIAQRLADDLVAEIMTQSYVDPDSSDSEDSVGPNSDERSGIRADFDDVDDYHNWISFPPRDKSGTQYSSMSGWARQSRVSHVPTSDFATSSVTSPGAKKILVQVVYGGRVLAEETVIRTAAWDESRSVE